MPWYVHLYHAAWLAGILIIGFAINWYLALGIVCAIAWIAFFKA
jgi:hypothetical protein